MHARMRTRTYMHKRTRSVAHTHTVGSDLVCTCTDKPQSGIRTNHSQAARVARDVHDGCKLVVAEHKR